MGPGVEASGLKFVFGYSDIGLVEKNFHLLHGAPANNKA